MTPGRLVLLRRYFEVDLEHRVPVGQPALYQQLALQVGDPYPIMPTAGHVGEPVSPVSSIDHGQRRRPASRHDTGERLALLSALFELWRGVLGQVLDLTSRVQRENEPGLE